MVLPTPCVNLACFSLGVLFVFVLFCFFIESFLVQSNFDEIQIILSFVKDLYNGGWRGPSQWQRTSEVSVTDPKSQRFLRGRSHIFCFTLGLIGWFCVCSAGELNLRPLPGWPHSAAELYPQPSTPGLFSLFCFGFLRKSLPTMPNRHRTCTGLLPRPPSSWA